MDIALKLIKHIIREKINKVMLIVIKIRVTHEYFSEVIYRTNIPEIIERIAKVIEPRVKIRLLFKDINENCLSSCHFPNDNSISSSFVTVNVILLLFIKELSH